MDQAIGQVLDALDERGHRREHHRALLQRQRRRRLRARGAPTTCRCAAARARPSREASASWRRHALAGRARGGAPLREHHVRDGRLPDPRRRGRRDRARATTFELDGTRSLWPAISEGKPPRAARGLPLLRLRDPDPRARSIITAFDDEWKLVQEVRPGPPLRRRHELPLPDRRGPERAQQPGRRAPRRRGGDREGDPPLAHALPDRGTRHPSWCRRRAGARRRTGPATRCPSTSPAGARRRPACRRPSRCAPLDWMHGETGRLIYDCEPWLLQGGLCK